ncbi:MAG: hypothetical protein ACTSWY_07955 [Promethearchaeota archaeon]
MAKTQKEKKKRKFNPSKIFTFTADHKELTNLIKVLDDVEEDLPKLETKRDRKEIQITKNIEESSIQIDDKISPAEEEGKKEILQRIQIKAEENKAHNNEILDNNTSNTENVDKKDIQIDSPIEKDKSESSFFGDVGIFLEELTNSYEERYNYWEDSTNHILSVMRKILIVNRQNSNLFNKTLESHHKKIIAGIQRFKTKRDYIEAISDTKFIEVTKILNKTLSLLALQLKEFKIKNELNKLLYST